jgi:regulator of protease activity HflC (stomatin/prohibitin superfamily)
MSNEIAVQSPTRSIRLAAVAAIAAVVGLPLLVGSWYTIDQGERGVILRNGAVVDTAEPGLHFKIPWIVSVVKIPVTQQVTYWNCAPGSQCGADEHAEMQGYSQDQQPAAMRVTVSWHVPASDVVKVYSEYGSLSNIEARLIARRAPQDVKTVFGQFTAATVIQDRAKFNAQVQDAIEKGIQGPVQIDSVQVENIDFSEVYEKSVEQAMQARVEVQRIEQQRQQQQVQAQITVINAQAAADATLAQAKAAAQAVQIRGEADAAAIRAKGDALKDNPNLIGLTQAERWDGKLPEMMVPGSSVPMINLGK